MLGPALALTLVAAHTGAAPAPAAHAPAGHAPAPAAHAPAGHARAPAPTAHAPAPAAAELGRGFAAYRAGDYHGAATILRGAVGKGLRNEDWALFLLGESEFYDGDIRAARGRFERLARGRGGRPAEMAPFRVADCLWMEGERERAASAYARLAKKVSPTTGDAALIRFRMAEVAAARDAAAARPQLLAIARDFPSHPLADEALRRLGAPPPAVGGAPGAPSSATSAPPAPAAPAELAPADRLRRAEALTKDRALGRRARRAGEAARRRCPPISPPSATTRLG